MATPSYTSDKVTLSSVLEDMFLVLTPKEKEVVIKRFSLDNSPRQTLERIGQQFSVTRERIRQIEKIALTKLRRTINNTLLGNIKGMAEKVLASSGGVLLEEKIVSHILKALSTDSVLDGHIVKLSLAVYGEFEKCEKMNVFNACWYLTDRFNESDIQKLTNILHSVINKRKDPVSVDDVVEGSVGQIKDANTNEETFRSLLEVDRRFKVLDGNKVGLMAWRHINPKSIRDKAYIVLKGAGKPLHFVEIANHIASAGFDKKVVTTQAVHNELIRDELFVLVGRGLYGLKEWGYKSGTVADVIADLLGKKSPLSKQDIIAGVLKQRQVKKGTISLNLQKNPGFARVGRAMYALSGK
ncbi:MAG: sigma factor-like helix-turn-helix DNA-binding protein [Patescibacteria group bacterium]